MEDINYYKMQIPFVFVLCCVVLQAGRLHGMMTSGTLACLITSIQVILSKSLS